MKKKTRALLFAVCLLIAAWASLSRGGMTPTTLPETPLTGPVVVELFTSQGCSSCPPADAYLAQLATRANVIALSCHVTYWDRLGWNDTLAREFCDERQRAYSEAQGRKGSVFTPEMVVNGTKSVVGNKGWMIVNALKDQDNRIKPVSISEDDNHNFSVSLPTHSIAQSHSTRVMALYYGQDQTIPIGRGENSGLNQTYARPIITVVSLLDKWDGQDKTISIPKSSIPEGAAGFVVIVQRGKDADGAIIAAGNSKIKD